MSIAVYRETARVSQSVTPRYFTQRCQLRRRSQRNEPTTRFARVLPSDGVAAGYARHRCDILPVGNSRRRTRSTSHGSRACWLRIQRATSSLTVGERTGRERGAGRPRAYLREITRRSWQTLGAIRGVRQRLRRQLHVGGLERAHSRRDTRPGTARHSHERIVLGANSLSRTGSLAVRPVRSVRTRRGGVDGRSLSESRGSCVTNAG
ncbi:hypothetical protein SAMN05443661_10610 [Natronobacterium gregoryi]|uniref:Uncharacterized protein n=2 Tax=Natronobacterium gregoryi TaxID=44930 RepID=L0AEU4_NATGS|nr:hypothetical protein Natgr_0376 [Natronobacterium gregoryi SP2]SFI80039.1 hypothetical protein SAMN05443661_10610 [Natronobacterium gregoryi]